MKTHIPTRPPTRPAPACRRAVAAGAPTGLTIAPVIAPVIALGTAAFSTPALAYVGPGAGLGVIGTLFGIVAALVLAMFGLFWYPIKRALNRKPAAADGTPNPGEKGADAAGRDAEDERRP